MTQLAGVDASFLYFETPETPMHVAGFTLFELPDGYEGSFYEDYRAFFESRLHLIPIFGKKLAPALLNLDHPIWVDDDDMDLDYHLRHTTLPKPGTFEQMEEVIRGCTPTISIAAGRSGSSTSSTGSTTDASRSIPKCTTPPSMAAPAW